MTCSEDINAQDTCTSISTDRVRVGVPQIHGSAHKHVAQHLLGALQCSQSLSDGTWNIVGYKLSYLDPFVLLFMVFSQSNVSSDEAANMGYT